MKRNNTQPLKNVIEAYLNAIDFHGKRKEVRLNDAWPLVVGEAIAAKTDRLAIYKRVLFVYLQSSVIRSELMLIRKELVKSLNSKVGERLIDEIVIR